MDISFEFFPPKMSKGLEELCHVTQQLASTNPAFLSVTYGAGGSTQDTTLEAVTSLQKIVTTPITPHLSCIGANKEELTDILLKYKALGLNRIIALRGDLPSGMGQSGEYNYAYQLVKLIRETTGDHFHISVAAYPEIHPQAKNPKADLENLKTKFAAGANCAITQYFFNSDAYFYYRDECYKQGIKQDIIPGIMPIVQFKKLQRFSDMCGTEIPLWLCKRFEAYEDDVNATQQLSFDIVYQLCKRLQEGGAPGLHFYTLNQAQPSLQLLAKLRD